MKSRPVEYAVTAVGSADAFEKVQVTARVAGVVEQVKFVEGETVETGQALVEIEPRRYQLSVAAARANVQKAEAATADAEAASRMVAVTAQVDDARRAILRPGAFADVTVPVGGVAQSPVIPQTAIRPSERGFLAFVVEDGKAHERVLTLGLRTTEGLVEVRGGLKAGEEALRDGLPVKVSAPGAEPDTASRPETRGRTSPGSASGGPSSPGC